MPNQTNQIKLPWLEQIPQDWKLVRAKNIFNSIDIRSVTGQEQLLSVSEKFGVTQRKNLQVTMFKAESYIGHKLTWPNDLVINSLWAWMGGLGFSKFHGIVSTAYGVYRLKQGYKHMTRYLDYLLRSNLYHWELRVNSKGIWRSRYQLTDDSFFSLPILVPPNEITFKIVKYLDYKCAQINKFIQKKKRLIELLKEQKRAIIYQTVTRGLDPNVRLKPSGVDWLGDIPEHWEIKSIKRTAKILRGKFSHRPRNDPALYNGSFPFIQTGDVARSKKYITEFSQTLNEKGFSVSKEFPKNTLVMTIAANIGDVAILNFDACFPDSIVGLVPYKGINLDFLYLILTSMKPELLKQAPVNTQGNLNVERIGCLKIAIPTINEQLELVKQIEEKTQAIDSLVEKKLYAIELAKEYCTRLISDVVTGQIDVRDVKIGDIPENELIEEALEEELEEESLELIGASDDD